ncbi:hypothetical protein NHX12_000206 [Muraenolepis orangiensis]|uniref:Uncharacterized protein n=1 Tax=Muraenolepis orangiensis TaxID=630683 RepID=A0A9Q0I2F1_9TELE|nr:hypothetical protein NHX12_000206 [Muraenolepis orangiensis]
MLEEREVRMVIGDESSKPSGKRKNLTEEKNKSKAKKVVSSSSDESEDESMSDYETKDDTEYSFECIKSFLDKSKGRKVKIGKHFSNLTAFIGSVKRIGLKNNPSEASENCFTRKETYRLRKLLQKAKLEVVSNDNAF